MVVEIRFFATLRDRAGRDSLSVELGAGSTVSDLVTRLSETLPDLAAALPSAIAAVNKEYAFEADLLSDGDEVAFFPPVSGGTDGDPAETPTSETQDWPEFFAVTNDELNVDDIIAGITLPSTGAVATFIGKVRGQTIVGENTLETQELFYEAFPEMAEAKLRQVADEIRQRWPDVEGIALVQRVGLLQVGTTTVLTACSAGHRNDGVFEAARYGIDRIKEIVPVWKKEIGPDGEAWVEGDYKPTPEDVAPRPEVEAAPAFEEADEPEVTALLVVPEVTVEEPSEPPALEGLHFACPTCGEQYPLDTSRWRCECGKPFELQNTPPFDGEQVETDVFTMWRYRAMLLPDDVPPVSLGEGWTPLLPATLNGRDVHLKLEGLNPSGSFKDRGTAVHVSVLRAMGMSAVHDDSSGNAGSSLAAYAARAGMRASVFVPAYASPVKQAQVRLYGAEIVRPEGPRSAVAQAARDIADEGMSHYASHVYNPLTVLGMKTLAYEIWEQLGSRNPDAIVLPVGHGSQLLGLADGFRDLLEAGAIDRLPRLIGVQAASCAPLQVAFSSADVEVVEGETVAEGVRIIEPVHREAILAAVPESEGAIVAVEEPAIMEGMRTLAKLGVMVEPTSAVVVPALTQIENLLPPDATVVLSLTGSGFKSPQLDEIAQHALEAQSEPV